MGVSWGYNKVCNIAVEASYPCNLLVPSTPARLDPESIVSVLEWITAVLPLPRHQSWVPSIIGLIKYHNKGKILLQKIYVRENTQTLLYYRIWQILGDSSLQSAFTSPSSTDAFLFLNRYGTLACACSYFFFSWTLLHTLECVCPLVMSNHSLLSFYARETTSLATAFAVLLTLPQRQEHNMSDSPSLPSVVQERRTQAFNTGPRLVSLFYSITSFLLTRETLLFCHWALRSSVLHHFSTVHISNTIISQVLWAFAPVITVQRDIAF